MEATVQLPMRTRGRNRRTEVRVLNRLHGRFWRGDNDGDEERLSDRGKPESDDIDA
jgi:hypothetical protein